MPSRELGEMVMQELYKLDKVAYIRFASVYRSFQDVVRFPRCARRSRGAGEARAASDSAAQRARRQVRARRRSATPTASIMARALALAGARPVHGHAESARRLRDRRRRRIIGEGWHERAGGAACRDRSACATRNRSGAMCAARRCTSRSSPAITPAARRRAPKRCVAAGVGRVVAAMADPNPLAAGGAGRLRAAGHPRRRRPARARGARAQSRLHLARDARPAVGADEGRREPRRPHGDSPTATASGSPAKRRATTATHGARAPARS